MPKIEVRLSPSCKLYEQEAGLQALQAGSRRIDFIKRKEQGLLLYYRLLIYRLSC